MPVSEAPAPWTERSGLFTAAGLRALGVPHGVTHRSFGSMQEPAARARALAAAGLPGRPLRVGRQVHGIAIGAAHGPDLESCDGWTARPGDAAVGVYVADCLPVFVWDRELSAAGVFHSGWRGTAAGMPREGARSLGLPPARLAAAIGPHIGACCYRVGPELFPKFKPEFFKHDERGASLDLAAAARAQLIETGLDPDCVEVSPECTACGPDKFFSFRREKRDARMLAFLALPE